MRVRPDSVFISSILHTIALLFFVHPALWYYGASGESAAKAGLDVGRQGEAGLEPCAGAHFMGTALREQGHQVRLIPAQFIKPYRKSNKNDFIDAEAIAEAVTKREHAVCADQDRGAARCASHAPGS